MRENRHCKTCRASFEIEDRDFAFYEKLHVPPPRYCPDCREARRLVFRNDRFYYSRTCDLCKKSMISLYDPKRIKNVYCLSCWWSDAWDPTTYGRPFDFNLSFFEQYRALLEETPKIAVMNDNGIASINCEYSTDFAFGKNCYMVLSAWYDEDCMFGYQVNHCKNCIDNTFVNYSQFMYECGACENSYGCQFCTQCTECTNCIFSYDLKNCSDCIFSAGLRNKKYCIWNKEYPREEFLERKNALGLEQWSKREEYKKQFEDFILKIPRKYANLLQCEDSTGDNLIRCKNARNCFNFSDLHDTKFMNNGDKGKDSYDCFSTGRCELCYDCLTPDDSYFERFCVNCWKSQYSTYSDNCHSCQNLFGCVNMKRKTYCILNMQYTKGEYEKLVPRIIAHMKKTASTDAGQAPEWGDFFNPEVSLFAYNETAAQEWHPLSREEAEKLGFYWLDKRPGSFDKETITWNKVPDSIVQCSEELCGEIFACIACRKNYRITSQEFDFYKNNSIPLPRQCIDCRHRNRRKRMNPKKLWTRTCMKCGAEIITPYSSERPEIVYCEKCYLESVY